MERGLSTSSGELPQKKLSLLTLSSYICRHQNSERNYPVCGILLRWCYQINYVYCYFKLGTVLGSEQIIECFTNKLKILPMKMPFFFTPFILPFSSSFSFLRYLMPSVSFLPNHQMKNK